MAAAAILDFQNVEILGVGTLKTAKMRQRDFSKMAAISHLGFVMSVFGPRTKGIWWSLSLCKIWLESTQQFW